MPERVCNECGATSYSADQDSRHPCPTCHPPITPASYAVISTDGSVTSMQQGEIEITLRDGSRVAYSLDIIAASFGEQLDSPDPHPSAGGLTTPGAPSRSEIIDDMHRIAGMGL